ncbi:MAG: LysR family transcriptional regulator [Pseudomonadota bacterium]
MDLKRMRHAIALADELNFARAAEKVHLSQPALSRSIQALEEELGLLLFDRDNRNVALTTVGAAFMEQARRLVFQANNLQRDMQLVRGSEIGQVAFGAGPLPTAAFLPQLLATIRRQRPGLHLTITSNNWRYLLQNLHAEEIEFFIADTRDIAPEPYITVTPLCRQYGPFMCRPGHPLLARPDRQPRDLLEYGFASLKMPSEIQALFRVLFGMKEYERLPFVVECDHVRLLAELAQHDDAILLATEAAVAQDIREGTLVPLHFDKLPLFYAEIGVVQLLGRTLSPGALLVLKEIRAIAAGAPSTAIYLDGDLQPLPARS